jgi:signal transduction histidine kinase
MDAVWILASGIGGLAVGAGVTALVQRRRLAERERERLAAERRALRAERLAELGSMTSGLAHEIKNPLSSVILNAQIASEEIAESELGEEVRQRLQRRIDALRREVERLRDTLSDFLRFAGRIRLDPLPTDLRRVVEELADFFHPQADQQGVTLRIALPDEPAVSRVDVGLLKQAILNLLINAVEAMAGQPPDRPRELMLRIDRGPSAPRRRGTDRGPLGEQAPAVRDDELRIHVIDTGPGIEPARHDAIFRPYMTSKRGGTGLGLATTRRIIEEHGGRIQLWSEPGKGSDFTVVLPPAPPGEPAAASVSPPATA